jgi:hypothetical protein
VKKRKVDKETNTETWKKSKKLREMNAWRDIVNNKILVSKELYADLNFPKIHVMSYWVEQIR